MRIALLAPRMTVHGPLPKLTPVLADALRRRGCEIEILPWGRRAEGEGIPAKLVGRPLDVMGARRAIVDGGFPVVVVHTQHNWLTLSRDLALMRAIRGTSRVVVLHLHGSQSPRLVAPGSWFFKRATTALLAATDGLLVLSREEQGEWKAFSPHSRVSVVKNPLPSLPASDVDGRAEGDGRRPTILCVSRLLEGKGVLELVRALPLVRSQTPCRLVLAGDGPESERARALAQELRVGPFVELPGYVVGRELANLYRSADVFALPTSLSEGFPMVIMEAMAAGLPIVTTASRGPVDHLVDGQNVLFVPPRDPPALAAKLARLLTDPELRRRMGDANRQKAREFDADAVAAEYLEALEGIVAAKHRLVRGASTRPRSRRL